MVSQGVANLVAGLTRAFPVGGSFSRSSLNRLAGATSPWAGAITGLCVLAALPATPLLADLPSAVLGAIVVVAVVGLVRLDVIADLVRRNRAQGAVAGGTLLATLVAAPRIERGVLVGIGLALLVHLVRELRVTADSDFDDGRLLVRAEGRAVVRHDRLGRRSDPRPSRPTGRRAGDRRVRPRRGSGRLDYSAAAALARLADELTDAGIEVCVINVPPGAARAVQIHLSGRDSS